MTAWAEGTKLDARYEITGLLGRGGMGTVLRGRHLVTGADVAVKMLHPHLCIDPEMAARFLVEARAPAAIGHPGIAGVLDAGTTAEGDPYLVMELLSGQTLSAALSARALSLEEIRRIGVEVLEALGAAHAAGFVHRDLKPDNIFLTSDGPVKVLDFGIAKVLDDRDISVTTTGALLGTLPYMSPEQLRSSRGVDHRTDLWAAGVVLHQMVTGVLPYTADGFGELLLRILSRPAPPLSDHLDEAPPGLAELLRRALAVEPRARFASAREMAAALRDIPLLPFARRPGGADMPPASSPVLAPARESSVPPDELEGRVLPPSVVAALRGAPAGPAVQPPPPRRFWRALLLLTPLVLAASVGTAVFLAKSRGPTCGEIVDRNRDVAAALRSKLTAVAVAVDAAPELAPDAHCAPPRPLRYDAGGWGNTDYLMYSALPGATPEEPGQDLDALDFHFTHVIVQYFLSWTDQASVLRRDEPASQTFMQTFGNIGRIAYLVVVKPRSHVRARGEAVLDTYLVELSSVRVLCGFRVTVTGNTALSARDYQSAIWSDARRRVFAKARRELDIDGEAR